MTVAFDTNVLVYAEGLRESDADDAKIAISRNLLDQAVAETDPFFLAAQTVAEVHNVLVRRLRLSRVAAAMRVDQLARNATIVSTTRALLETAFALAARHDLPTFDAVILAAAADARCDVLYSEDFQHGFAWRGVEVVDPFR